MRTIQIGRTRLILDRITRYTAGQREGTKIVRVWFVGYPDPIELTDEKGVIVTFLDSVFQPAIVVPE
jgi:hypothetical protein